MATERTTQQDDTPNKRIELATIKKQMGHQTHIRTHKTERELILTIEPEPGETKMTTSELINTTYVEYGEMEER